MTPAIQVPMRIQSVLPTAVLAASFPLYATELSSPNASAFPIQYREGLIWVEVQVTQTAAPLNFLLDTGAGVSVLNLGTAKRLCLHAGTRVTVQGVGTNTTGLWPQPLAAKAGRVALPGKYLTLDLSTLSASCTCPIDGIIGADFFNDRVVTIDFANQRVTLQRDSRPLEADEIIPLKNLNRALLVSLSVNGSRNEWFRLDTGCASSLQWVTGGKVTRSNSPRTAVALGKLSIDQTTTTVRLGDASFDEVPTGCHRNAIFGGEAGLLGNGLLSRFEALTIDAKSGRLLLRGRQPESPFLGTTVAGLTETVGDTD